jgi:SNF2 family DNA or RNA helicase
LFLRRTKTQVLTELPPRSEQVLRVELGGEHRATYLALLAHQRSLMEGAEAGKGAALLEALLRLRQAACHPGLVDPGQAAASSAKLEVLVEQLAPLVAQGQKALVFSSFTGLLDLTAQRLEREGWRCLQLDGRTRDRAGAVRQFQAGEADVFLLSLKAGGTGLNLTAASYVFLLDPWWNPAAERQAIDRAHRLGQQQPVSAYRLVSSDTIEDQVLALAASKRELFDGLFGEDAPALGKLAYEELVGLFRASGPA